MLNLILVSAGTIVIRSFTEGDMEIIREIAGDVEMMRQVLITEDDKVIFESNRGKRPALKDLRDFIANRNEIRRLNLCEKLALSRVIYKAV